MTDKYSFTELYQLIAEQMVNDGFEDVAKLLCEKAKINHVTKASNTLMEEHFYNGIKEKYEHQKLFSWDKQTSQFADPKKINSVLAELSANNNEINIINKNKNASLNNYKPLYHTASKQPIVNTNFSLDGKYIALASADHSVKIIDAEELNSNYIRHQVQQQQPHGFDVSNETESIHTFTEHTAQVNSVCFHPNNQFVFSGADDKKINFFKIKDSDKQQQYQNAVKHITEVEQVAHVSCHLSGQYLFVTTKRTPTIRLYEIETSACFIGANALDQHSMPVLGVGMNSDASVYISWSMDGNVKFWDGRTSRAFNAIMAHNGTFVTSAAFKNDDYTVLTSGRDNYVKLFDMRTSRCYFQVEVASQQYQNMNPAWFNAAQDQVFFVEDRNGAINSINIMNIMSEGKGKLEPAKKIVFKEGVNIRHFACSSVGPCMVVGCDDGKATVYHAK